MTKNLLILGAVLAAAVVVAMAAPRVRRVTEEEALTPLDRINTTTEIICNSETACGWSVYTPFNKNIEYYMDNNYCNCAPDLDCSIYDDDISIGAFVHRCQSLLNNTTPPGTTTMAQ